MSENRILSLKSTYVNEIYSEFNDVFTPNCQPIKDFKVHLELKKNFIPKFMKCLPFALKEKVESQIKESEAAGIISYVENSVWASQIVVATKKNGDTTFVYHLVLKLHQLFSNVQWIKCLIVFLV